MVEQLRFKIEGAEILYPNFKGREGPFNALGDRNFCVILDNKTAKQMKDDGWNVKFPDKKNDEDDVKSPYIQISLKYKYRPPKVVLISSTSRTYLNEEMVEILDGMDFANVDLIANASHWEVNGKTGIKAYLKTLYVTLDEDDLDLKYGVVGSD